MATSKKSNSKKTATTKKTEQPAKETKETKAPQEMSVDELASMFINNDTETIERMKEENAPVQEPVEDTTPSEPELAPAFDEIMEEVKAEQPKEDEKPVVEKKEVVKKDAEVKKVEEPKKTEQPASQQPHTPNNSRTVYGYDHFGMIYEW